MIDVLGKILVEVRDDPTVAAITTRVRGEEIKKGDIPPMVIIRTFPIVRSADLPYARHQFLIQCFGKDFPQARELMGAVSNVLHDVGPRQSSAGKAIYRSQEETSGSAQTDPDTQWPFYTLIVTVHAATVAVVPS